MEAVARLLDRVSALLCDLAGALLLALVVLINVEVVLRYGRGTSTLIADEYGGYLFVWLTLLGFGHALRSGQFLRVEFLVERLGRRGRATCEAIGGVIGLVVSAVALHATYGTFASSLRFGTVSIQPSATPLWIPQLVTPVALAWLCVLYLDITVRSVRALGGSLR